MTSWQGKMVIQLLLLIAKILLFAHLQSVPESAFKDWDNIYLEAGGKREP